MTTAKAATHRELLARLRLLTEQAEMQRLKEEEDEVKAAAESARQCEEALSRHAQEAPETASEVPVDDGADKHEAVAQVRALMEKLDVTVVDILASIGPLEPEPTAAFLARRKRALRMAKADTLRRPASPGQDDPEAPVRYRRLDTGETWSGEGRVPLWIHELEKRGISRDQFQVS